MAVAGERRGLSRSRALALIAALWFAAVTFCIMRVAPDDLGDEIDTSGVFVVLEKAHLKYAKIGRQLTLLNAQDHADYLMRNKEDPALYRPDIVHQALMSVLDSPLNKAGKIRGVYIHTTDKHVIFVDPHARIPRMFRRFCGLIVEVLQRMSVRSSHGGKKLLKLVRSPVSSHFPIGCRRIAFSHSAGNATDFYAYTQQIDPSEPLVLIVGAMAHGNVLDLIEGDVLSSALSVSKYPLSAACAISRILGGLERRLGIL